MLNDTPTGVSIAILGCGKMGTAILQGLLASRSKEVNISHIGVTVRRPAEVQRIQEAVQSTMSMLASYTSGDLQWQDRPVPHVSVRMQDKDENGRAAREAEIVILGCKPNVFQEILRNENVRLALLDPVCSKILVSMLGGVTIAQLKSCLYDIQRQQFPEEPSGRFNIVRIIPNIAARIQQSVTVVSSPSVSDDVEGVRAIKIVSSLFSLVGPVIQLDEIQFNTASAVASSSIAFYASLISASADGGLCDAGGEPLSRKDGLWISAQAARGASSLILDGQDPGEILNQVVTKRGSTEAGLQVMQEKMVASAMILAVSDCARVTATLSNIKHD